MIIDDLWWQPINENEIMGFVSTPQGKEYSFVDLEWEDHEHADSEKIYNTLLEIAHDYGYVLEGEQA